MCCGKKWAPWKRFMCLYVVLSNWMCVCTFYHYYYYYYFCLPQTLVIRIVWYSSRMFRLFWLFYSFNGLISLFMLQPQAYTFAIMVFEMHSKMKRDGNNNSVYWIECMRWNFVMIHCTDYYASRRIPNDDNNDTDNGFNSWWAMHEFECQITLSP